MKHGLPLRAADLRGLGRLGLEAVLQVTDLVEAVHGGIQHVATLRAPRPGARPGHVARFAYGSVRGVTRLVGAALERVATGLDGAANDAAHSAGREAVLAALNGVLGDHLEASGNPFAIPLHLRHGDAVLPLDDRAALRAALPDAQPRVLVLLHGLCMSPWQWRMRSARATPDTDIQALAESLGYSVLLLHYNSGRHVAHNGRELAGQLQALVDAWPRPISQLTLLGHSMGGLVARSACHAAQDHGHGWVRLPVSLICLGTPHHGAPLERAGNGVDRLLAALPLVAPFARLGHLRSAGITDLRHGAVSEPDVRGPGRFAVCGRPHTVLPLPETVALHVLAGTRSPSLARSRLRGDGLVPVASALGQHRDPERDLAVPASRKAIIADAGHLALLHHPEVLSVLGRWLRRGNG